MRGKKTWTSFLLYVSVRALPWFFFFFNKNWSMWIGYFICKFHFITGKQYCQKWKSLSRVWLCDPIDCSLPGSSVHGLLQARVLEWIASPLSRGSSQPTNRIQVSRIAGGFFTVWATREAQYCQKLIIKEGVGSAGAGNPRMNTHSYF